MAFPRLNAADQNHQTWRTQPLWVIEPDDIAFDPVLSARQLVFIGWRDDVCLVKGVGGLAYFLGTANSGTAEYESSGCQKHGNASCCLHVILHKHLLPRGSGYSRPNLARFNNVAHPDRQVARNTGRGNSSNRNFHAANVRAEEWFRLHHECRRVFRAVIDITYRGNRVLTQEDGTLSCCWHD